MYKNVASQQVFFTAWYDGARKTGLSDVTVTVSQNGGTPVACTNTPVEVGTSGTYVLVLTQAETNADAVLLLASSATAGVTLDPEPMVVFPYVATAIYSDAQGRVRLAVDGLSVATGLPALDGSGRVTPIPSTVPTLDGSGRVTPVPAAVPALDGSGRVTPVPATVPAVDGSGRVTLSPAGLSGVTGLPLIDNNGRVTPIPTAIPALDGSGRVTPVPAAVPALDEFGRVNVAPGGLTGVTGLPSIDVSGRVKLSADGLDDIRSVLPTDITSANLPEMLAAIFQWFYGKAEKDPGGRTIKVYANDNATVVATISFTDNGAGFESKQRAF